MVALKDYRPNNLNINPFQIGQELAKTYDYDGVLDQIGKWNALGNAESVADLNEIRSQTEQQTFELDQKRREAVEAQVESGVDPLKIDYSEINRSIGDFEGVIKAEAAKAAAAQERSKQYLPELARASKLIQDNPAMKDDIVARLNAQGIQVAPQQFANKGSGDKPDKPKAPKLETWIIGDQMVDVDMNDLAAVREARNSGGRKRKDLSASALDQFEQLMEDKLRPPSAPEGEKQGFFSWLNGDKAPEISKGNRDTQAPTVVPPGMKLQRNKATGEVRMVPINGR